MPKCAAPRLVPTGCPRCVNEQDWLGPWASLMSPPILFVYGFDCYIPYKAEPWVVLGLLIGGTVGWWIHFEQDLGFGAGTATGL